MATEIDEILEHIKVKNHFLLSGGAGSGKTHTLISLLQNLYALNPKAHIACITFTNVASDEIKQRANFENLHVSTIHDFLWLNISSFQVNLKDALLEVFPDKGLIAEEIERVDYREYRNYKKGIISHEDIMVLSEYLFTRFPLLSKILKDKYDFILVDEYQDTFSPVINILFNHLNSSKKKISIGLFGDSMQSIFEKGIENVNSHVYNLTENPNGTIREVLKKINRRNPQSVIDLANKIRLDDLWQNPEKNSGAPNNDVDGNIKPGSIKFLYSESNTKNIEGIKNLTFFYGWDFENPDKTKELFLSHNLIANRAGFANLMDIYYKDKIVGGDGYVKRIKDYIKTIDDNTDYTDKTFEEVVDILIKNIDVSISYESAISELLDKIVSEDMTYLRAANALEKKYPGIKAILPTDSYHTFISSNLSLFELAKNSPYEQLTKIYLDKDKLIGKKQSKNDQSNRRADERDLLVKYLMRIQEIVSLYQSQKYFEVISKVDFKIRFGKDKLKLKQKLEALNALLKDDIGVVIDEANTLGICTINEKTQQFFDDNKYLVERVRGVNFAEVINLYNYTEGNTIYSTQHGIKGAEFENVLVSLDPSGDRKLNYKYLFEQDSTKNDIVRRTQKLFYVCCTRAMENLVVFYKDEYTPKVISQANAWFGSENVINLDL